jgi:hypothetical protein
MNVIEIYLTELMGDYSKKFSPINNSDLNKICYFRNLYNYPTIQMVIISPLLYNKNTRKYILNEDSYFEFFIYDLETDLIIGYIDEIEFDENWEDELAFYIFDAENRLNKFICPKCEFWLVQRINKSGHRFLGCYDYPECNFSCEIGDLD